MQPNVKKINLDICHREFYITCGFNKIVTLMANIQNQSWYIQVMKMGLLAEV